jgi:hypothetical protein
MIVYILKLILLILILLLIIFIAYALLYHFVLKHNRFIKDLFLT